jgi:hypothetical protein
MASKAKLKAKIKRLKRKAMILLIESNDARARAGQAHEALSDMLESEERITKPEWDKRHG